MNIQLDLFDLLEEPLNFPCDNCGYEVVGCCDYPETEDNYCILGDKWIPRNVT